MLPLNIGLPKTPHGLFLDNMRLVLVLSPTLTNQGSNWDLRALTQCYPNTGPVKTTASWCLSWGEAQSSFTRWQAPPIPASVGVSSNGVALWVISKITGGFRVIAPFTPPFIKYNCWYFIRTIGLEFSFKFEIKKEPGWHIHRIIYNIYISTSFTNIYKGTLLVLIDYKLRPKYNKRYIYMFSKCIIQWHLDKDLSIFFIRMYNTLYG